MDIGNKIEALRVLREETPFPAAVPSAPLRMSLAAVETIKQAKASEFPTKPSGHETTVQKKKSSSH